MNRINDGGPAFPVWELNGKDLSEMTGFGMSLRDYFAAKAMQGLLFAPGAYSADADTSAPMATWDDFAAGAYEMADAMLRAREASND